MPEVSIARCEPIRLVAFRHTGAYMEIGEAFGRIGAYAARRGLFGPNARMVGVFHDDPCTVPEAELRSDAGVTIVGEHTPEEGTHLVEIDGGEYACATHEGHYGSLADTYRAIMRWVEDQGRKIAPRPTCEIYLNSPMNTAPDDLRTEVRMPVQ